MFHNFCTISYFFRRSTVSAFGSYFFFDANFARNSAAVIFKFNVSPLLVLFDWGGGGVIGDVGVALLNRLFPNFSLSLEATPNKTTKRE